MSQQMLRTLLAVNRQYYSGFKWLDAVIGRMRLAPPDLAARLRQVFAGDPVAGSRVLAELIEATYDLVEREFPAVDVEQLRRWFRWRRPVWDTPPPDLHLDGEDS